jgi:hypothetical protein
MHQPARIGEPPPNFVMSRAEYMEHLERLIVALVRKHGELKVGAVQELANQLIVQYGVRDAHRFV